MPRTARAVVAGYCYHLINRGNNQATVFHEHADYAAFISLIAETQERIALPILAVCLMPNHMHLVVRPAGDHDLSSGTECATCGAGLARGTLALEQPRMARAASYLEHRPHTVSSTPA